MVREPVHLSDWIEFLNRKVDRNNTLSAASIAVLVALITLFFAVWSFQASVFSTEIELAALSHSTNTSIDIRNITNFIYWLDILKYTTLGVIGFQIGIALYVPNMPQVKRARKLLNEIMQNPKDIEIDEIRKEWYSGGKNMRKKPFFNEFESLNIIVKLGFIPFIIGIILIMLGKTSFFGYISCYELGLWFTSLSLAIMALGYAIGSDEKMQSVANYHLLEIKGIIEDRRLNLQKYRKKISFMNATGNDYRVTFDEYHTDYLFSMWKTLENLRQVQATLKYSTPNYQIEVIDYVNKFFEILRLGRNENLIQLRNEDKTHIHQSLELLSNYPAFNQYSQRGELIRLVDDLTTTESIVINGVQNVNINDHPVILIVADQNCDITVSPTTNLRQVSIIGDNSTVRVSRSHSLIRDIRTPNSRIIYYD